MFFMSIANKNKSNFIIHKALRKYGIDCFSWDIIYQSLDRNHCLNVMENYFIMEYKTYIKLPNNKGYNMTIGGDGVLNASDFWTEDRKKKQSILSKERFFGIPKTVEHKINMSGPRVNFKQSNEQNNSAQKIKTPYGIFDSIKTAELYIKQLDINTNYNKIYYNLNNIYYLIDIILSFFILILLINIYGKLLFLSISYVL